MSTKSNENNVAKATEIKPASESGLMRKTKSELVQIILRRDSEFVEDKNTINNLKFKISEKEDKISTLNGEIKDIKKERDNALKQAGEANVLVGKRDNTLKNKQQEIDTLNSEINDIKKNMNDTLMHAKDVERCYNTSKVFNIILAITTVVAIGIIILR